VGAVGGAPVHGGRLVMGGGWMREQVREGGRRVEFGIGCLVVLCLVI